MPTQKVFVVQKIVPKKARTKYLKLKVILEAISQNIYEQFGICPDSLEDI